MKVDIYNPSSSSLHLLHTVVMTRCHEINSHEINKINLPQNQLNFYCCEKYKQKWNTCTQPKVQFDILPGMATNTNAVLILPSSRRKPVSWHYLMPDLVDDHVTCDVNSLTNRCIALSLHPACKACISKTHYLLWVWGNQTCWFYTDYFESNKNDLNQFKCPIFFLI